MMCFINRFNLLNTNQFGILAEQNTSDAVTEFSDKAYDAINQKRGFLPVFIDFSKAFVTVDQGIRLKRKLYCNGFRGKSLDWFRSYLINGSQFVEIKQQLSSSLDIKIGVPQGSTLGPLLFI